MIVPSPFTHYQPSRTRKHVLVVNCYFDDSHQQIRRPWKVPQAMGPAYLAGAFSSRLCEVRLYDEVTSSSLEDERLLAWPDMLVLTGLTNSFDRMLHLTAYVRTKNPNVIVVAGGPPIRASLIIQSGSSIIPALVTSNSYAMLSEIPSGRPL